MLELHDQIGIIENIPPNPLFAHRATIGVSQVHGDPRTVSAIIYEILAYQHPIDAGIARGMSWVLFARFGRVERISLQPAGILWIPEIDVIAAALHSTSRTIRLLSCETGISIVFLEAQYFRHTHRVDEMPTSPDGPRGTSASNNPITRIRGHANIRLAGGERAITIEWIRRESAVVADDIGMKSRH